MSDIILNRTNCSRCCCRWKAVLVRVHNNNEMQCSDLTEFEGWSIASVTGYHTYRGDGEDVCTLEGPLIEITDTACFDSEHSLYEWWDSLPAINKAWPNS